MTYRSIAKLAEVPFPCWSLYWKKMAEK